jgi:hypothetical protein
MKIIARNLIVLTLVLGCLSQGLLNAQVGGFLKKLGSGGGGQKGGDAEAKFLTSFVLLLETQGAVQAFQAKAAGLDKEAKDLLSAVADAKKTPGKKELGKASKISRKLQNKLDKAFDASKPLSEAHKKEAAKAIGSYGLSWGLMVATYVTGKDYVEQSKGRAALTASSLSKDAIGALKNLAKQSKTLAMIKKVNNIELSAKEEKAFEGAGKAANEELD